MHMRQDYPEWENAQFVTRKAAGRVMRPSR